MKRSLIALCCMVLLVACGENTASENSEPPVRGLKTQLIQEIEETVVRRFPSVLQPSSTSVLSFEISGRLQEVSLDVGQRVAKGDVLAEVDPKSLDLQVETAKAALAEAESRARNAATNLQRKEQLLKQKVIAQAALDEAKTEADTTASQVLQAKRSLDTAQENLTKAALVAPFDGILNSVEVQSFTNVSPGAPVATLYAADDFEASFSVSFEIVNRLAVGKKVVVRLADNPSVVLAGHVSELGARADTVSSFPVVVKLDETDPSIKAGMAVEVAMDFTVPSGQGFSLPLSVLPFDGKLVNGKAPDEPGKTTVFVFDPDKSTVHRREVSVGGVRENSIIIVQGLKLGERVAVAGVSFLREGQKVKLLPDAR
ncbi:MAG: efflux RND transporter periplasmic adaptor subunit [Pseudomonadota bacterium]